MIGRRFSIGVALAGAVTFLPAPAFAQVSAQDSFRIGSGTGVVCTAQAMVSDRALVDMFDRGYRIACRDAATAVGQVFALRARGGDPVARLAGLRSTIASCEAAAPEQVEGLGAVETLACRRNADGLPYKVYILRRGNAVFVAEGLGGYDSAIELGLRSVVADREVEGEVSVATTGAGDPIAFARAQAGTLDPQRALAEAYRRNNAGSYAESAEFFARLTTSEESRAEQAEALVNEALQKSNLGRYAEADALFARGDALGGADPVIGRRLRNYRAMHLLNQGRAADALTELDRPLRRFEAGSSLNELVIDGATAARLSAESPGSQRLGGLAGLSPEDKAQILDAQALQLRGTVHRLQGRPQEAVPLLEQALGSLVAVRSGRIAQTLWLRAQILGELADIAEASGDRAGAERQHRAAVALLQAEYPGSSALLSARGQLAAFYARTGRAQEATSLYRELVAEVGESGDSSPTLRRILAPYFELLIARGDDPAAVTDLFAASQIMVRPGVAQTQAVLARELSGGSDEASRLFRQSVNLTRDIERSRIELARIEASDNASGAVGERAANLRESLAQMQQEQVATQARLAEFPRYRVVSGNAITLADLQQQLREGEAYYKMLAVNDRLYAIFATPTAARAWRLPVGASELETRVDTLRSTITVMENGQQLTYPFNVELAHQLYGELFTPIAAEIAGVNHLVFEPDGAMLRLPPNILVMDQAGVEAYRARATASVDNEFDFRGVQWLGRDRDISTAVSARAFRDVRQAPASRAAGQYLGFGQNLPADGFFRAGGGGGTRSAGDAGDDCAWSLAAWSRPISAAELFSARTAIAAGMPGGSEIITGAEFTDTAILQREDLSGYRILHFATHGLVTAPRPECPARPALLTSFGAGESDGLLTFSEIFDLRLDADLIVLSACDTAGRAGLDVTREAGLGTGGDFALDGLVRAFVGAGGRMVVASHWPVPDDYNATQRLISGMFDAPPGTSVASALRTAERSLMDDPDTSHPYYWAGFAVIGDGTAPVIRPAATQVASSN